MYKKLGIKNFYIKNVFFNNPFNPDKQNSCKTPAGIFLYSKAAGFRPQIYQIGTPPLTRMEFYWSDILHIQKIH